MSFPDRFGQPYALKAAYYMQMAAARQGFMTVQTQLT